MLFLQFFHNEELLLIDGVHYKATCRVRNDLNGWRHKNEVVKTFPTTGKRLPYYPRPFPTGLWEVKRPEWTDDPDFAPVKIPTNAKQNVMTQNTMAGIYSGMSGIIQEDAFYHLHYADNSSTTLGCIRLNSAEDAADIANKVTYHINNGDPVYLEVNIKRG